MPDGGSCWLSSVSLGVVVVVVAVRRDLRSCRELLLLLLWME